MHTTINSALVEHINRLVQDWNTADRRCREFFHGWEQRAMRAGLERGFYVQVSQLPSATDISEDDDLETAGRAVYDAYRRGSMIANMDSI